MSGVFSGRTAPLRPLQDLQPRKGLLQFDHTCAALPLISRKIPSALPMLPVEEVQTLALALILGLLGGNEIQPRALALTSQARLQWVDSNAPGISAHFVILVFSDDKLMHSHAVQRPHVTAEALLGKMIPGEYRLKIFSVDRTGAISKLSTPLRVAWLGSGAG